MGVVNGRAGSTPVMDYIPQDADVSVGDEVITSGLGGNFPKNLIIGQVVEVNKRDFDMYQQAVVRPTVNFDRLEFVLVITNFQPGRAGKRGVSHGGTPRPTRGQHLPEHCRSWRWR